MTRAEWLAREAGTTSTGSALDGLYTLRRYAVATIKADLSMTEHLALH